MGICNVTLGRSWTVPGQNPARELVGGKGKGMGKNEISKGYLFMASIGAGVVGVGLPVGSRSSGEVRAPPVR
jgi:hypothetical protein